MTHQPLRNIAIIAHVDHGKTTLVDEMLKQSGTIASHKQLQERAMDSNALEQERGITILAKCTAVEWKETRINIVDTPGHADFGGEVERILSMVDGVVLLVDAAEGPMPQTKFVLSKALRLGLCPVVIINKYDRQDQRAEEVLDEIFDLFVALEANDAQLDFPVLYASGRNGWAVRDLTDARENLHALFETIISSVPKPKEEDTGSFQMLVTTQEYDPFLGRILTGRIHQGVAKMNDAIKVLNHKGELLETGRLTKILGFRGLLRVPLQEARAGDIVAIAGLEKASVSDTLAHTDVSQPLQAHPIDPPTLAMTFSINDSPLAGTEGKKLTSRVLKDRLWKEAQGNIAIRVSETEEKDAFEVAGRGELQLGVLIETMRREGFELSISRPRVLFRTDETTGKRLEPIEEATIDVDEEYSGIVVETLNTRKGNMVDMRPCGGGKIRIIYHIPARGLIGYHGLFLTQTRGTGVISRMFHSYEADRGAIDGRHVGVLISNGNGEVVAYGLRNLEERGFLFVGPGDKVYEGMIIGEHSRDNDLEVNPLKSKQLTNVRASGKDEAIRLTPPRRMTLEEAIAYIQDDERVEVTPLSIRLRKAILCPHERKKAGRAAKR
jgi:GTP-binding protein